MTFKKEKFKVVRETISNDLALFIYNYFCMQRQVYDTCRQHRYLSPYEAIMGYYEGDDNQVPGTYSQYGNVAMETLMLKIQPIVEKATGMKLQPCYTYARIYKKGDVLKRHKDRFSCEISCTIHLGSTHPWPLYIEADPTKGKLTPDGYISYNTKGIKVDLKPGDMIIYHGMELEHWREEFKGEHYGQAFLHYNNLKTPGTKENMFDKRPHLGLPSWFRGR